MSYIIAIAAHTHVDTIGCFQTNKKTTLHRIDGRGVTLRFNALIRVDLKVKLLWMLKERQHILLNYFKSLGVGSAASLPHGMLVPYWVVQKT